MLMIFCSSFYIIKILCDEEMGEIVYNDNNVNKALGYDGKNITLSPFIDSKNNEFRIKFLNSGKVGLESELFRGKNLASKGGTLLMQNIPTEWTISLESGFHRLEVDGNCLTFAKEHMVMDKCVPSDVHQLFSISIIDKLKRKKTLLKLNGKEHMTKEKVNVLDGNGIRASHFIIRTTEVVTDIKTIVDTSLKIETETNTVIETVRVTETLTLEKRHPKTVGDREIAEEPTVGTEKIRNHGKHSIKRGLRKRKIKKHHDDSSSSCSSSSSSCSSSSSHDHHSTSTEDENHYHPEKSNNHQGNKGHKGHGKHGTSNGHNEMKKHHSDLANGSSSLIPNEDLNYRGNTKEKSSESPFEGDNNDPSKFELDENGNHKNQKFDENGNKINGEDIGRGGNVDANGTPLHQSRGNVDANGTPLHQSRGNVDANGTPLHQSRNNVDANGTPLHQSRGNVDANGTPLHQSRGNVDANGTPLHQSRNNVDANGKPSHHSRGHANANGKPSHHSRGHANANGKSSHHSHGHANANGKPSQQQHTTNPNQNMNCLNEYGINASSSETDSPMFDSYKRTVDYVQGIIKDKIERDEPGMRKFNSLVNQFSGARPRHVKVEYIQNAPSNYSAKTKIEQTDGVPQVRENMVPVNQEVDNNNFNIHTITKITGVGNDEIVVSGGSPYESNRRVYYNQRPIDQQIGMQVAPPIERNNVNSQFQNFNDPPIYHN